MSIGKLYDRECEITTWKNQEAKIKINKWIITKAQVWPKTLQKIK